MNAAHECEVVCTLPAIGPERPTGSARAESATRILHVAECVAGGIASFFEEIAAYQSERFSSNNVRFLVPDGNESQLPAIEPARIMTFAPTARRPNGLMKFGLAARDAIRAMQPDIVHLHSSFAGAVVRALLPRPRGTPRIVYSPHGWSFGMEVPKAAKLAFAAVERRLAERTDLILVNSVSEYQLGIEFGIPERKMQLVKHGISWIPAPQRSRKSGPMQIAFVGRHDRQKGLEILLDTIRRFPFPDIHFHVVGERVLCRSVHDSAPAPENVTFHGWLSRADTSAMIQLMDAVVMPSRWEAFGLVAIEAMRAGVAVIGSDRGALPEVIRDGIGGQIFDIDDPDALGCLLQQLEVDELQRLGASARRLWEREYGADEMNRRTCEAYASVLASPAPARSIRSAVAMHRATAELS